jgi:hypothetical protein
MGEQPSADSGLLILMLTSPAFARRSSGSDVLFLPLRWSCRRRQDRSDIWPAVAIHQASQAPILGRKLVNREQTSLGGFWNGTSRPGVFA